MGSLKSLPSHSTCTILTKSSLHRPASASETHTLDAWISAMMNDSAPVLYAANPSDPATQVLKSVEVSIIKKLVAILWLAIVLLCYEINAVSDSYFHHSHAAATACLCGKYIGFTARWSGIHTLHDPSRVWTSSRFGSACYCSS